jgi:hypothetical protein
MARIELPTAATPTIGVRLQSDSDLLDESAAVALSSWSREIRLRSCTFETQREQH